MKWKQSKKSENGLFYLTWGELVVVVFYNGVLVLFAKVHFLGPLTSYCCPFFESTGKWTCIIIVVQNKNVTEHMSPEYYYSELIRTISMRCRNHKGMFLVRVVFLCHPDNTACYFKHLSSWVQNL